MWEPVLILELLTICRCGQYVGVWERMKLVIETGAACAVAALSPKFKQMAGPEVKKVGVILCGGNVDLEQLPWMPK